jgi:general secretion pathway protein G
MRARKRRRKGFTLMEVLLVLAILVILGAMVSGFMISAQRSAFSDSAKVQMENFKQTLMRYRLDVGTFPTSSQGLESLRTPPPDLRNPAKWRGPYLEAEVPLDPWDSPYKYEQLGAEAFKISSFGPDQVEGTQDDIFVQSGV